MPKARILLILGVWVTVLSYLGFPYAWKDILFTCTGFGLVYLSYVFYKEDQPAKKVEKSFDNFSENKFEGTENTEV